MHSRERWNRSLIIFLPFVLQDKPSRKMKVLPHVSHNQPNKILCFKAFKVRGITWAQQFFPPRNSFCWMWSLKLCMRGARSWPPLHLLCIAAENAEQAESWLSWIAGDYPDPVCQPQGRSLSAEARAWQKEGILQWHLCVWGLVGWDCGCPLLVFQQWGGPWLLSQQGSSHGQQPKPCVPGSEFFCKALTRLASTAFFFFFGLKLISSLSNNLALADL